MGVEVKAESKLLVGWVHEELWDMRLGRESRAQILFICLFILKDFYFIYFFYYFFSK